MSDGHKCCRDVRRDEAVRAAEDAAAVPAIQHRDLPEQVALLWASVGDLIGRVVRLEGEMDAGQGEEASPAEGLRTERVTLEVTQRVEDYVAPSRWNWCGQLGSHAQPGESVRVVEETKRGRLPDMVARLTAERDAAILERDEAKKECERLRAKIVAMEGQSRMETEAEIAVEKAWERCGIAPYWPDDEPGTSHRYAKSMEAEIVRLRARVAELEANANTATILAKIRDSEWSVASELAAEANAELSAASAASGWLTAEERAAVEEAMVDYASNVGDHDCERIERVLRALLARETPPRVRRPDLNVLTITAEARDLMWFAAIRAAGGEVDW